MGAAGTHVCCACPWPTLTRATRRWKAATGTEDRAAPETARGLVRLQRGDEPDGLPDFSGTWKKIGMEGDVDGFLLDVGVSWFRRTAASAAAYGVGLQEQEIAQDGDNITMHTVFKSSFVKDVVQELRVDGTERILPSSQGPTPSISSWEGDRLKLTAMLGTDKTIVSYRYLEDSGATMKTHSTFNGNPATATTEIWMRITPLPEQPTPAFTESPTEEPSWSWFAPLSPTLAPSSSPTPPSTPCPTPEPSSSPTPVTTTPDVHNPEHVPDTKEELYVGSANSDFEAFFQWLNNDGRDEEDSGELQAASSPTMADNTSAVVSGAPSSSSSGDSTISTAAVAASATGADANEQDTATGTDATFQVFDDALAFGEQLVGAGLHSVSSWLDWPATQDGVEEANNSRTELCNI